MEILTIPTKPYDDQKPGTSGLRKKVKKMQEENYIHNFVQSVFDVLPVDTYLGGTLLVSGDGRYYNREAIKIVTEIAIGNGVKRVWIAKGGLISTPAASCLIREREEGAAFGGFILTASHNPGGPDNDLGIKYNCENGGPAQEKLTEAVFERTKVIDFIRTAKIKDVDVDVLGVHSIEDDVTVEVIDGVEDWMKCMKGIFDFESMSNLLKRKDFKMVYDGMHGVAGPYAKALFHELGVDEKSGSQLMNCDPKEDFGGGHPDPNLTYGRALAERLCVFDPSKADSGTPDFGAAGDGDNDRNMILGKGTFITPSDSVAIISHYAPKAIPYFSEGLRGVSRSMPTSKALDRVAKKRGLRVFEVPTGWKFFCNLMDDKRISICGEESFGTGSDHIREKDGLWAVLAWLSILAHRNQDENTALVSMKQILEEFWTEYGRTHYCRYDYEEVSSTGGEALMAHVSALAKDVSTVCGVDEDLLKKYPLAGGRIFDYTDPVDLSVSKNQGVILDFKDGSRGVWRLSGTGSSGATVRMYLEMYQETYTPSADLNTSRPSPQMKDLADLCVQLSKMEALTGRKEPTVIT